MAIVTNKLMKKNKNFSASFLEEIEKKLIEMKADLEQELSRFSRPNPNKEGDHIADFPQYGDSDEDNAREVADFAVSKSLEITLEKQLRDVDASLVRLKDGSYGICKYTNKPIDKKRLLARPTSSSSIDAKKLLTDEY
jgi:DnaK suppressor protein